MVEEATTSNTILAIIYLVVLVSLLLFESGYSSKITEETIHGSTEPPRIGHFFEMCRCGVSEACVIFTYFLIGVICSDIMEHYQYDFYISIGLMLFLTVLWFMMDTSLVYMAYKKGSIVDGLNIFGILKLYLKLGFSGTFYLLLTSFFTQFVLVSSLATVPSWDLIGIANFILRFTLAPITMIFSFRLFALQARIE